MIHDHDVMHHHLDISDVTLDSHDLEDSAERTLSTAGCSYSLPWGGNPHQGFLGLVYVPRDAKGVGQLQNRRDWTPSEETLAVVPHDH